MAHGTAMIRGEDSGQKQNNITNLKIVDAFKNKNLTFM